MQGRFFMQLQKNHLTNYPNEYNLKAKLFKCIIHF